ncbi:sulfatase-like hydrolase/transferase [Pseudomonadota bacterium]
MRLVFLIISVASVWVFSEWLFFATKPSFMTLYSFSEKVGLLCGSALVMSIALLIASIPFAVFCWLIDRVVKRGLIARLVLLTPGILLLALAFLLLIDNFTLTLLGWGIRNAGDPGIWAYRILTVGLLVYSGRLLLGVLEKPKVEADKKLVAIFSTLIVAIGVPLVVMAVFWPPDGPEDITVVGKKRPNIIILSSDGLWANHMSLYGYERQTTPFMDSVRAEFLVAENHFANASDTGGSVISLLSGKQPTSTRVIYPPDVMRGVDSFQHLPSLLKKLGYYNADISMRHYADPYDLNMRDGFAEANFRKLRDSGGHLAAMLRKYPGLNSTSLFTDRISERLSQRFFRILVNEPIQDPLSEVDKPHERWIRDDDRVVEIRRLINEIQQPLFLHVHMMGTHGSRFKPRQRVWSTEESYNVEWDEDGFDDAILDFDRYVEEVYQLLEDSGKLDSSILIISSDHGFNHGLLQRLPMLMRLPGQTHTGILTGNTQRLDIAPTLVEFIGMEVPAWMEGRSMLSTGVDELNSRPIFASGSGAKIDDGEVWSVINPQPPWYSLGRLYLIKCNQGFVLNTDDMSLQGRAIEGSTVSCPDKVSLDDARQLMLTHLKDRGYLSD